ncbi:hypothetical protein ABEB36_011835 [Hypothenemus hampei]
MLAIQTGLTYIQVCNWFANWRRKLKNAGKEPQRRTWGELIKTYNSQVQGNVEHFSISSGDSIWAESETTYDDIELQKFDQRRRQQQQQLDHTYNNNNEEFNSDDNRDDECYYVTDNPFAQKYKNHIIEKYMRDTCNNKSESGDDKSSMIAKWLQSAERFRPNEGNYIDWSFNKPQKKKKDVGLTHGREELDAAEALTCLANAKCSIVFE